MEWMRNKHRCHLYSINLRCNRSPKLEQRIENLYVIPKITMRIFSIHKSSQWTRSVLPVGDVMKKIVKNVNGTIQE